eukprot:9785961-Alexandrium_andersonii.AAC.1
MPSPPHAQPCDRAGPAPPSWARPQRGGAGATVQWAGTSPRDTTMIAIQCILPTGQSLWGGGSASGPLRAVRDSLATQWGYHPDD